MSHGASLCISRTNVTFREVMTFRISGNVANQTVGLRSHGGRWVSSHDHLEGWTSLLSRCGGKKRIERFLVRKCRCPFFKQFKGDTSAVLMLHTWHYNSIHWTNTEGTKFSSLAYHLWNDNMATYTVRLNIYMCTYNIWSTRNSEILAKLNALVAGENLKKKISNGGEITECFIALCV